LEQRTPNTPRKCNDNAESLGILSGTVARLEAFQDPDHYRENNDFASRANSNEIVEMRFRIMDQS